MTQCLVSEVFPAYSGEKYLEKTVQPILNKPYKNIELILVDDGLNGNSQVLIETLALKNPSIKAFYQPNGAFAKVRNCRLLVTCFYSANTVKF